MTPYTVHYVTPVHHTLYVPLYTVHCTPYTVTPPLYTLRHQSDTRHPLITPALQDLILHKTSSGRTRSSLTICVLEHKTASYTSCQKTITGHIQKQIPVTGYLPVAHPPPTPHLTRPSPVTAPLSLAHPSPTPHLVTALLHHTSSGCISSSYKTSSGRTPSSCTRVARPPRVTTRDL